jgi:hypothetical protein
MRRWRRKADAPSGVQSRLCVALSWDRPAWLRARVRAITIVRLLGISTGAASVGLGVRCDDAAARVPCNAMVGSGVLNFARVRGMVGSVDVPPRPLARSFFRVCACSISRILTSRLWSAAVSMAPNEKAMRSQTYDIRRTYYAADPAALSRRRKLCV